ncbi:MAG: tetratricopeptide repeat protein [Luteolibacter sp.]|uniref:tetratricopeptide repeat protein n=1 Tax=Luteolibacter sp. TaxID=1962973 RepID=UPI00326349EB
MKPLSIKSLLLVSALFTPWLQAQDTSAKVREIEQKVLQKQYLTAVDALVGSAHEGGETSASPDLIGKRVQWLTLVGNQIEGEHKAPAANQEEMTKNAGTLNELAWNMITSPDEGKRSPEIALKLADIAIELAGGDRDLKPKVLDTKARALFLLGKHAEAIAEQEKAIAAATVPEEKAGFEATLAGYRGGGDLLEVRPETPAITSGAAYIVEKLRRIVIPRIDFEDATVEEAIDFLRLRAAELDVTEPDPAKKGVNFVIRLPRLLAAGTADAGTTPTAPDAASDPGALRVKELRLRNVPLAVALKYICDQTKLRFKVDDFAVTLVSPSEEDKDLFTRTFNVPPDFASSLDSGSDGGKAAAPPTARRPIMELLKSAGINFGEGSSVTLTSSGTLLVTNTPSELDKIEQLVSVATVRSEWTRK